MIVFIGISRRQTSFETGVSPKSSARSAAELGDFGLWRAEIVVAGDFFAHGGFVDAE